MSKKKAFSGSTMTLKDFHGGSIPSDLPLPSAPGAIVRTSDRSGFDRQTPAAWGNPIGRSDHRSRPGSSGASRNFDEKASFLSHPAHIGRNFDEDERKPLDGVSIPRRTISDETLRVAPSRPELKQDSVTASKFSGRQVSNPVTSGSSHAARYTESIPAGMNSQHPGGSTNQAVPNAWGRKELKEVGFNEPVPASTWSGPGAISRFAQASALEKVSSGRWQSKQSNHQLDIEVLQLSESQGEVISKDKKTYNGVNQINERGELNEIRGGYPERGWIAEDGHGVGGKELPNYERPRSAMYSEAKESISPLYPEVVRPASTDGKYGGSQLQTPVVSEVLERPKLKLLPRSKPLETVEPSVTDYKMPIQGYQQPYDSGHLAPINELHGNANPPKPGSAGTDGGRVVERPKLNLKPRTQLPEQSEGSFERERKSVFGGARPRELVLKERGVDDVAIISNLDPIQSPNRVKHDLPKSETRAEVVIQPARYGERSDNFPLDQRTGRDPERKDHRGEAEKIDTQRNSWRKDSRRNVKGTEKPQQEQRPEPESWRKPVEQPKSAVSDAPGLRYGKATSALELAQAFSKSVSSPKASDNFSGQRGMPGRNQIPFSRLTATRELHSGPTPRRQINGY